MYGCSVEVVLLQQLSCFLCHMMFLFFVLFCVAVAVHPSGPTRVIRAICNCRRTTANANIYHVIPSKFTERSPLIQKKN